ncbi:hypothetical protein CLAFUW4_02164 [Fulvia fulva]|uniref:Thioesterase domain-containing protein n=1 Tax=Passalora fulva TaxID=5499 RepID=A0A9Q8P4T3_PASFU|nr:uncharacterized protein CLAFUR5_02155 [Fulvia fulva]UJO13052.1 hypothetical protein CLAFUR5_02155 [Fulvia fulva]WPV10012.1 hypothetical protein CLAFUW4_02164 [Fulvia fulva]
MSIPHRALRPALSLRYQHLYRATLIPRAYSTSPPPPRKSRLPYIWSAFALVLGFGAGTTLVHFISPPSMPEAGTHEDGVLMDDLNKRIEEEFKVKVLRGKCLGVTKALQGKEAGWVEVVAPADGMGSKTELVKGLQGAKGLGVERIFWDRGEQKLVGIVWFGGSLSGWPGVTHGGLLATALQEKVALANTLCHPTSSAQYSSAAKPQRLPGTGDHAKMLYPTELPSEPAQLSIDYIKPTHANHFYTVRVVPSYDDENVRLPIKGAEWVATLETMDGKVCVKATAKFAPRGQVERMQEGIVGREAGSRLRELREWLWPSRQRESLGD